MSVGARARVCECNGMADCTAEIVCKSRDYHSYQAKAAATVQAGVFSGVKSPTLTASGSHPCRGAAALNLGGRS